MSGTGPVTLGKDGRLKGTLRFAQIQDADGAALVVHAKPDDYRSQPSGGAGDRLACGVLSA